MRYIAIFFLISCAMVAYAQEGTFKSKVKLKDGSELQVVIIENNPGKFIKILLPGNTEATISYENILSIKHKNYSYQPAFVLPQGIFFEGSTSLLFGRSSEYNGRAGLVLGFTTNYRFNSAISVGLGIDPTILTGYLVLPVYAHISGNFTKKRVAPIYFIDTGWSFAKANSGSANEVSTEGGWFVRPGIGLRINRVSAILGYQLQKVTTTSDITTWWGTDQIIVEERLMKNFMIGASLSF